MSDSFQVKRGAARPREFNVTGTLPSGHGFTLLVTPWSGSRCTDAPDIRAGFDVDLHPGFASGSNDALIDAAIAETNRLAEALDERLRPLVDGIVARSGIDEAAAREVIRVGVGLAQGREVPAGEVEAAVDADVPAFEERREAHLRPIAQANWEEAQEHEQGLRF